MREDVPLLLAPEAVAALRRSGHTLAVAESCTGGWLGRAITAVPGSSAVFWGGVIAYSDAAKRNLLGVPAETLLRHGAVSAETARAMARGIRERSGATWGVSVTGIAGPGGGSAEKPIGTVWIAVEGPGSAVEARRFAGDREAVRRQSVETALRTLTTLLAGRAHG